MNIRDKSKLEEIGRHGTVLLELEQNDLKRTILANSASKAPLLIQRALYPNDSLPDMAHLYIMSTSGGILQNDKYDINIVLKAGASAHITTQGATRVYGMVKGSASQNTSIRLDGESYLEYLPHQVIPYKNSRYSQQTCLQIHDSATLVYSEALAAGRTRMGESFEYDSYNQSIECRTQDGRLRFLDIAKMRPQDAAPGRLGMLGGYSMIGTVYVVTPKQTALRIADSVREMNGNSAGDGDVEVGSSMTMNDSGVLVRVLGNGTEDVFRAIHGVFDVVRRAVLGVPFNVFTTGSI